MLFSLCKMEYLTYECINYSHDHVIILGLRDWLEGCCDVGKKAGGRGIAKFSIFGADFTFLGYYGTVRGVKVQKIPPTPRIIIINRIRGRNTKHHEKSFHKHYQPSKTQTHQNWLQSESRKYNRYHPKSLKCSEH